MALTFPSSPTNGQIYTDTVTGYRYSYNSSAGVWSFAANSVGMSVSSTPPANVAPGAMWFNREIGRTFVYYDDGDSKQWIETVPATGSFDGTLVSSYANTAAVLAVAPAYNTANAALANTSGTFAGNLSVTGNVGVGTISPTYKLQSNGTFGVTGSAYSNTNVHSSGFSPAANYSNYLAVNIRPDVFTPPIDGQTIYGVNLNPRLSYSGSTSASMFGLNISAEPIDTGNNAQVNVRGIQSVAWRQSPTDNTTNTNCSEVGLSTLAGHWWTANSSIKSSSAYGSSFSVYNYTGTITTAYGVYSLVRVGSQANYSANTTTAYGFYSLGQVGAASGTGTGNLTNWYDAYLGGITVSATGTVTNKYGVYQAATGHINYFAGNVGVGTAAPTTNLHVYGSSKSGFKMTGGTTDSDIFQRHLCQIDNVYTWTTLLSITPSTVGASWMRGFVKCSISCHNSGNGNGALIDAIWYLDLNGGSGATTAQVSAGTTSGSWPGQFRVNMSGNIWQLQVQSTNTANRFDGVAMFDILLSHGAGTAPTYTIA